MDVPGRGRQLVGVPRPQDQLAPVAAVQEHGIGADSDPRVTVLDRGQRLGEVPLLPQHPEGLLVEGVREELVGGRLEDVAQQIRHPRERQHAPHAKGEGEPLPPAETQVAKHDWDYIYEPDAASVLDHVLNRYVESLVYQAVLENVASEHAARMVAMKAASDNATKLIGTLNLVYNKARQAAITQEISEIVGGAAAV